LSLTLFRGFHGAAADVPVPAQHWGGLDSKKTTLFWLWFGFK
jgi:hypothetical protein